MSSETLREFVEEATGESHLRIEHDFGDGFVRLQTSEAERRQAAQDIQCSEDIVIELLRNSRDAHAGAIFLATSREGTKRKIVVIDDGDGIPASMHKHVFEPRVTSKLDTSHMDAWGLHGRGMALFSISRNAQRAEVVSSDSSLGCALAVETNTDRLGEKVDQSSFPQFLLTEEGSVNIRGPKNITRTACEFAIESRDTCSVYLGSPAEIAASIYAYGTSALSAIDRAFCQDVTALPLIKRLATAADPKEFTELALQLGLQVSERTARRILDGQLLDVPPLLEQISIEQPGAKKKGSKARSAARKRAIKLQQQDTQEFVDTIKGEFQHLAQKYYLEEDVQPEVRVVQGQLVVTFPLVEKP